MGASTDENTCFLPLCKSPASSQIAPTRTHISWAYEPIAHSRPITEHEIAGLKAIHQKVANSIPGIHEAGLTGDETTYTECTHQRIDTSCSSIKNAAPSPPPLDRSGRCRVGCVVYTDTLGLHVWVMEECECSHRCERRDRHSLIR